MLIITIARLLQLRSRLLPLPLLLLPLLLQHEHIRSEPAQPKRRTLQRLDSGCLEAGSLQAGNLEAGSVKAWHRHNDTAYILSFIHGIETMTPLTRSHFMTNLQPIQSLKRCLILIKAKSANGVPTQASASVRWCIDCSTCSRISGERPSRSRKRSPLAVEVASDNKRGCVFSALDNATVNSNEEEHCAGTRIQWPGTTWIGVRSSA